MTDRNQKTNYCVVSGTATAVVKMTNATSQITSMDSVPGKSYPIVTENDDCSCYRKKE
jgi:hypothetical protein